MVLRQETISAVQWATYIGAGFGLGALLWLVAARLYHREQLAISA
jgi:sodium transport system permease protein